MHKCSCGTEFEGKFCPECGAKWEEDKVCPKCGAKSTGSSRFCNECGHPFVGTNQKVQKEQKTSGGKLQKIYGVLSSVPAFAFVLFAILLFAFYAAPVAIMPEQEFLGEKIAAESYGNVYSMYSGILGEMPELKNAMLALIIVAVASAIYGVLVCVSRFTTFGEKRVNLGKNEYELSKLFSFGTFLFYLVYLVTGIIICSKISALDEGMGAIAAGSCPKMLIAFSIIFALIGAGSMVARNLLNKKIPELEQNEIKIKKEKELAEKNRKEEFYKTHQKPSFSTTMSKKEKVIYKHQLRMYNKAKEGTPSSALVWIDGHKAIISLVAVLLVVAIIGGSMLFTSLGNIFRVKTVEKIELGSSKQQVTKILGDPYLKSVTDYRWQYFSDEYLEVLTQIDKNTEQQEKAMEMGDEMKLLDLMNKEAELLEKLETITYAYIEINFEKTSSNGFGVSSVYLEPNKNDLATTSKKVVDKITVKNELKSVLVDCYHVDNRMIFLNQDVSSAKVNYKVSFKDGAYYSAYENQLTIENNKMLWNDMFASYESEVVFAGKSIASIVNGAWNTIDKSITNVVLPDSVTSIGEKAFYGCSSLTSIEIPNSVTSIGSYAFANCSSITNIIIPDSVTSIGEKAFSGCSSLETIEIPNSVTSIGDSAFV
ncbi:MAG: leucine-rich repeat protein [Clostridia bacterium]|nr:leucine-rich repeat protein [Clostridia bacterium]